MMKSSLSSRLLTVLAITVLLASCRYKLKDGPQWESEFTAPLLKSSVSLGDAITDTNLIKEATDKSLTLVIRDTVIDFVLSEFLTVPDTSVQSAITLDSIRLPTDSITQQLTVADLLGAPIPFCINLPGGLPTIDTFLAPIDIDASTFFKWAKLNNGEMQIEITNNAPTDIDSVEFTVANQGLIFPGTIVNFFIETIPEFTVYRDTVKVEDMLSPNIESTLEAILNRLKVAGSTDTTLICPDHYIEIKIRLVDLGASEAEAVFPEQDIVNTISDVVYDFGDGIALTQLGVKAGDLRVEAFSTILDTMEFNYVLPSGRLDGEPIRVNTVLAPPVPPATTAVNDTVVSLAGYSIDMTKNGDKFNRFTQEVKGSLRYSGECRLMTLEDTIFVSYGLESIVPNYVEGYFGIQTFDFTEGIKFDFFNSITGGTLNLRSPKMKLTFLNSIGMDGELKINAATAINSRTGETITLSSPQLSNGITIPGPRLPNVGQVISYEIDLNSGNSNVREFVSVMPDSLYFDIQVVANKSGSPALLDNFATDKSAINAIMDVEIPLEGITSMITLETDSDLDLTSLDLPAEIKEGSLKLIAENWFPMDATIQVYFKDNSGLVLDSLIHEGENGTIAAGMINGAGIVEEPNASEVSSFFDSFRLDKLQGGATKATIKFSLSTRPLASHVKLYSNYEIGFKLVSDFKYQFN